MNLRQFLPLFRPCMMAAILLAFLSGFPAKADLVVSVGSATVAPGSTGDSVDVDLTNTGTSAVSLGGFSFGVSVVDPDIIFTEANISTVLPYLFAGDSFFGPVISFPPPSGSSITASDIDLSGLGITLNGGQEVGLGHLLFDVGSSASTGTFTLSVADWPATSLSDPVDNDVPITSVVGGQIQIAAQAVPEPSGAIYLIGGVMLAIGTLRRASGKERG